jgi:hypothetical protein
MPNDYASFDQMTPNPKNGQMTRSFPNTGALRNQLFLNFAQIVQIAL